MEEIIGKMDRRNFFKEAFLASTSLGVLLASCTGVENSSSAKAQQLGDCKADSLSSAEINRVGKDFKMKFAPRQHLFRDVVGGDELKRLDWIRAAGFTAVEGITFIQPMKKYSQKDVDLHFALGEHAQKLGLQVGSCSSMNEKDSPLMSGEKFVFEGKSAVGRTAVRALLVEQMEATFAVLRRVKSNSFIIGAGAKDLDLPAEKQYENVVENMKFCADYCSKNGFFMLIEPLNVKSHKNIYFDNATLGAKVAEDVGSPHCKILFDIFHEQMQVGNLDSLDNPKVWAQIQAFHFSDSPTRQEPFTGTIDFKKLIHTLKRKAWSGIIGLEHSKSEKGIAGDMKVLNAYRRLDSFA